MIQAYASLAPEDSTTTGSDPATGPMSQLPKGPDPAAVARLKSLYLSSAMFGEDGPTGGAAAAAAAAADLSDLQAPGLALCASYFQALSKQPWCRQSRGGGVFALDEAQHQLGLL